ncbi:MAG: hypothetical protein CL678_18330 [Bdellovibrionaceae bacterium]|nr:hypothetical protein [Pseudobdellovibrionaceae bacterium]|tara:strand:+ start:14 stop:709 length:696 start_codon:yes stop_codon:yes gene_type:complete
MLKFNTPLILICLSLAGCSGAGSSQVKKDDPTKNKPATNNTEEAQPPSPSVAQAPLPLPPRPEEKEEIKNEPQAGIVCFKEAPSAKELPVLSILRTSDDQVWDCSWRTAYGEGSSLCTVNSAVLNTEDEKQHLSLEVHTVQNSSFKTAIIDLNQGYENENTTGTYYSFQSAASGRSFVKDQLQMECSFHCPTSGECSNLPLGIEIKNHLNAMKENFLFNNQPTLNLSRGSL